MRTLVTLAIVLAAAPAPAEALCRFYVDTGGAQMFSNATQVVLMREGTRTVLSAVASARSAQRSTRHSHHAV